MPVRPDGGRPAGVSIGISGDELQGTVQFADYEFAQLAYRLVRDGFMPAAAGMPRIGEALLGPGVKDTRRVMKQRRAEANAETAGDNELDTGSKAFRRSKMSMSGPVGIGGFEEGEFEGSARTQAHQNPILGCALIEEVRFASDSVVEGAGFEPSVPGESGFGFAREGPNVRIQLPPGASPLRTDFSRGRSRTASRI
jgi:hypothetical protein